MMFPCDFCFSKCLPISTHQLGAALSFCGGKDHIGLGCGLSGPEGSVEVDIDNAPKLLFGVVERIDVRDDATVGHDDVEVSKVGDDPIDGGCDRIFDLDVSLVGNNFDTVLLGKRSGEFRRLCRSEVYDSHLPSGQVVWPD
jgi:hypothetical protein